ncbi:restriction endonuclease subunit S [Acinetobacter sp. B51(2017)]|uniref:restriction endonuclease subunit S n=1 Tax=Acinetobacter sp. B51(2017) TaxID=2060938 RepID=UPI000F08BE25|nr:restriction endonuclease subunit S [Acinetobacter sp. B51(2017)]
MSQVNIEWKEVTLNEVVTYKNGQAHEMYVSEFGDYCLVNSKFISTEGSVQKFSTVANQLANKSDILMVLSDVPNGRAIAKCFFVDKPNYYTVNQRIALLTVNSSYHANFIFRMLNRNEYFLSFDDGVKQTNLKKKEVLDCPLRIPPLAEQQKIAQALTDADNYISALEKLIEKKKMIKEGLMVNLLTGKQRLKEFAFNEDGTAKGYKDSELGKIPEDWNLKYFTDVFSFLSTASFSRDQLTAEHNTCACIHYGDIHTKLDYCIDTNTFVSGYVSTNQVMNYAAIQQGDLIIADASEDLNGIGKSIEVLNQPNIKVVSGLHTFLARDIKENFALGFRSFISSNPLIIKQYKRLASGLKVYSLSKSTFKNIILALPSKDEQESISKILFNHIKEIETLNKKLEKAKAIKIGMMQKLLTGEIRFA